MTNSAKRVLITGSRGFTGVYMAGEMAAAGYQVIGLGSQPAAEENYIQANLNDADELNRHIGEIQPDIVIHLAALAFVGHGDPKAFYDVNLVGTRNLLQSLADCRHRPEAVLVASSANVYGNTSEGQLDEQTAPLPANDYAVSKLAMEYMAKLWMPQLPMIITRPFNYTGVGQAENFLLPKIVSHFCRKAEVIELGNVDVARDFSDVRTLVAAYRRLLEARAFGRTVNVCSGRTYSLRDIISMCSEITGHEIEIRINPEFVRKNEVRTLSGDNDLLKTLIGDWEVPPIRETLRWMLNA